MLAKAAGLVRKFVEDYHEKLEEEHLFPRFEKAKKLVDLVAVLRDQHKAGRVLTDFILAHASTAPKEAEERRALTSRLRLFIRMYRPHEAREDTVLFPAIRSIVSPHEYGALGEEFEDKEHELFGEGGFEEVVASVAGLEKATGYRRPGPLHAEGVTRRDSFYSRPAFDLRLVLVNAVNFPEGNLDAFQ